MTGPVLAGILSVRTAEEVLSLAFDEAQDHAVAVWVVAAGLPAEDEDELSAVVGRWSGKYPDVAATVSARQAIDPAIVLTAASRVCSLAVLARPTNVFTTALIGAVERRSGCPVLLA